jgi:membrane protein implicated in regulation of membrane protease activity
MAYWHWLVIAALCAVIELAAPATVCLWLAAAALGVAAVVWLMPDLGWEHQALVFAVLAIAGVLIGRLALVPTRSRPGDIRLNRRAESYVGRTFTLDRAIIDGRGRLKVDDTVWLVEGPDLPIGSRVRVVGTDNTLLRVESV